MDIALGPYPVPAQGRTEEVIVTVDEARHHHGALQVDNMRALRHRCQRCIWPVGDDPAVLHGQSGELSIKPYRVCHGDHAGGIVKHSVRTWLTHKSRDVFIHESASVKMPPQHNEINAFSEEDAHGEHVFPL